VTKYLLERHRNALSRKTRFLERELLLNRLSGYEDQDENRYEFENEEEEINKKVNTLGNKTCNIYSIITENCRRVSRRRGKCRESYKRKQSRTIERTEMSHRIIAS